MRMNAGIRVVLVQVNEPGERGLALARGKGSIHRSPPTHASRSRQRGWHAVALRRHRE